MGANDQQAFLDAVAKTNRHSYYRNEWDGKVTAEWGAAVAAFCRMSMVDMLPAFAKVSAQDRKSFLDYSNQNSWKVGDISTRRINFAYFVVEGNEIRDFGIPDEQVNDGREFLGCTRLDNQGVQEWIDKALVQAPVVIGNNQRDSKTLRYARNGTSAAACCGKVGVAWAEILVMERRAKPNASLISNLAAAAHYMLSRFHVCDARARQWQMDLVTEGYDAKKRIAISVGDKNLKSMALTANPPFPPDFAIAGWAHKGAADGEADRKRCNADASLPLVAPTVNSAEWGFE